MARNSLKISNNMNIDIDISISYDKLCLEKDILNFLKSLGKPKMCNIELKPFFAENDFYSLIDLVISKTKNGLIFSRTLSNRKYFLNKLKFVNKESESEKSIFYFEDTDSQDEKIKKRIKKSLLCNIINTISEYINDLVKIILNSKMTLSQKNMILYKMNIIPKEFDKKNDELFYMIYIQNKLKKNKCNLSDDFLENLKKYIDNSRNNNLITEIAPFLSEGQLNFILWDYKDILPEWFKGKSDKLRLKYNILMYERFNNDFTYNFHGKNQSFYTLEETKSDTNEKYILEDSKNVKECNLIDESTNNYKLNNIDNSDTQNKFCILENNINKTKINNIKNKSKINDINNIDNKNKINNHKLIFEKNINPFDLPPGWQEAFFDRKYVSNIIQEKIKILIEETRIDQEKQFDIKNLNLKKEVINFIMKSASKSFFLKTINLCNQFLQETKLLQENSEESHFIKEINFLNLQEKSTKIYFTQKIISNKNVIKYSESVDYNSKDEIIAFVFDNGIVSGNFVSKNEKNTFLPLPGQLKIIIFKKHNKFYQMQNHDLIFQKISRQIFIKYEKDEILLFRKNYSKKKIFFEVIKGNPKIEENFDSVKFKGEKFKLLVEISENNWENVIQK